MCLANSLALSIAGKPLPINRILMPIVLLFDRFTCIFYYIYIYIYLFLGITKDTEEVPGGTIVRDKEGNPTGTIRLISSRLI